MPGLVGRQRELEQISGLLTRAEAGTGAIALAIGEPGIGKTSLLEAATADAARRGFAIAWGRAWEVSSAPPYWPWIEVLRELAARGTELGALADVLPDVARRGPTPESSDPWRLYDAVLGFLQAAAAREPIAIVLDDLHAADPSTVKLAELVAPHIRRMPMVLFASYRDVEARRDPQIETGLARLGRHAEALHLSRLDVGSVGILVRERFGRDDKDTTRMIHDASDGNPLFVGELLKLVAARGADSRDGRDVPAGVRAVIRERLALLSPATVALLQAAAIIGRTFGVTAPADVAGVTPGALEDAINEAVASEVVEAAENGRFRFSHALVAETLVADLAPAVRAKLHRRAAEALERAHERDPAAPLAEIARHWARAGAEHAARAVSSATAAARAAASRLAFEDAGALYEDALKALAIAAPNDLPQRAELLVAQGDAYVRAGDRTRASGPCKRAGDLAAALDDGVLFARAALAYGADAAVAMIDASLVEMLERALAHLPDTDNPWRAKVAARLAAARQPATNVEEPVALAREAIAMARRVGDPIVLRDVLFSAVGALVDFAQPAERAALNEELLDMLGGDTVRTLRTLQRLAFDRIELGDLAGFVQTVVRFESLGVATNQLRYQWQPQLFRSMQAYWEGRLEEARRYQEEAFAIRERLGDDSTGLLRTLRTNMLFGFGDAGDAIDSLVTTIAGPEPQAFRCIRAWALVTAGRLDEADHDRQWLLANPSPQTPVYHALNGYAEVAWTFRDRELAARHQTMASVSAGRAQLVTSVAFMFLGVVDHGLMRTALVLEDWQRAQRYRDSALVLCDRLGAFPLRAQIAREWAEATASRFPTPTPSPTPTPGKAIAIVGEGEYWTITGCGELCRIKDSRGIQMLARLVGDPGRELHVLDLAGADVVDAGDAGTVIDRAAREQYMTRVRDLQQELAEASAWNDTARREKLEAELDAIAEQLSSAYGLGGREKRSGGATERARTNVRRRLADAMQRIEEAAPALGRHFARTVKTGVACCYDPDR